jgi:hypothetical protein
MTAKEGSKGVDRLPVPNVQDYQEKCVSGYRQIYLIEFEKDSSQKGGVVGKLRICPMVNQ